MRHLPSELVHCWKRWIKIVEDVAMGQNVERHITAARYAELQRRLLELCNRHGTHPFKASAKTAREIAEFVQEWDSLDTLQNADPERLLRAVAQAQVQFKGRVRSRGIVLSPSRTVWFLVWVIVIGGIGTYIYDPTIVESIPNHLRRGFNLMTRFARQEREKFYGITILIVILGGIILYSTKKA